MFTFLWRFLFRKYPQWWIAFSFFFVSGCATYNLEKARYEFYNDRVDEAICTVSNIVLRDVDRVLLLMERGMIYHQAGKYKESINNLRQALDTTEDLDYYSISKGTLSFIVNDRVLAFCGAPYERIFLHSFTALNCIALERWDEAAVEAKNIADKLDYPDIYPEDLFSRYLAAFCFEVRGFHHEAVYEYRKVAEKIKYPSVDPETGRFNSDSSLKTNKNELVCFFFFGRGPRERESLTSTSFQEPPFIEIYAPDGEYLGRSYIFTDIYVLKLETDIRYAAMKIAKKATRIVIKDMLADTVSKKNKTLGDLLRWILFKFEMEESIRCWETLPRWCHVARVWCPEILPYYDIVIRTQKKIVSKKRIFSPIVKSGSIYISFYRVLN